MRWTSEGRAGGSDEERNNPLFMIKKIVNNPAARGGCADPVSAQTRPEAESSLEPARVTAGLAVLGKGVLRLGATYLHAPDLHGGRWTTWGPTPRSLECSSWAAKGVNDNSLAQHGGVQFSYRDRLPRTQPFGAMDLTSPPRRTTRRDRGRRSVLDVPASRASWARSDNWDGRPWCRLPLHHAQTVACVYGGGPWRFPHGFVQQKYPLRARRRRRATRGALHPLRDGGRHRHEVRGRVRSRVRSGAGLGAGVEINP